MERNPAGTHSRVDNPAVDNPAVEVAVPLEGVLLELPRSAERVVVIVRVESPAALAPYPKRQLEPAQLAAVEVDSAPGLEHSPPHWPNQRREHKAIPA